MKSSPAEMMQTIVSAVADRFFWRDHPSARHPWHGGFDDAGS
jgi:hypothetical protein